MKMKYRKHGTRLLGLLVVAALGVMAFAASAQAVAPGFLINKKPVGELLTTVGAVQVGTGTMLVPGLNFELNCTGFTVDEGHLGTNTDAKGVLLYTGCTTLTLSALPTIQEIHCHVKEPVKAEALLLPTELNNGEFAILAEKIKALVTLHLIGKALPGQEPIEPCVLPLDNTVTGELCLKIDNNDTIEPTILASSTIQGECKERPALEALTEGKNAKGEGFKDVLKYGAQTVTLDGAAKVFLNGEKHKGLTLGVSLF